MFIDFSLFFYCIIINFVAKIIYFKILNIYVIFQSQYYNYPSIAEGKIVLLVKNRDVRLKLIKLCSEKFKGGSGERCIKVKRGRDVRNKWGVKNDVPPKELAL